MTHRRFGAAVLALSVLMATAPRLSAHEEYRMVGTLVKVEPAKGALLLVTVRFKWEPTDTNDLLAAVYVWNTTVILRDNKKVPVSELKAGVTVVIDALGDEYNYSDAQFVRIVPPLPAQKP